MLDALRYLVLAHSHIHSPARRDQQMMSDMLRCRAALWAPLPLAKTAKKRGFGQLDPPEDDCGGRVRLCVKDAGPLGYLVSINAGPAAQKARGHGSCIGLVLDNSGSMGETTTGEAAFTFWSLVAHAAKVAILMMTEEDQAIVVTFSSSARTIFAVRYMDEAGKRDAITAIEAVTTGGGTNLLAGVTAAFSMADLCKGPCSLLLLTDGIPVNSEDELQKAVRHRSRKNPCNLHAICFGDAAGPRVLNTMAKEGGGIYAYIPGIEFLGTVIIHLAAWLRLVAGAEASLSLNFGAKRAGIVRNLQGFHYGQTSDIPFTGCIPDSVTLTFRGPRGDEEVTIHSSEFTKATPAEEVDIGAHKARTELARLLTCNDLQAAFEKPKGSPQAQEILKEIGCKIRDIPLNPGHAFSVALAADIEDQILMGLEPKIFWEWGYRYLLALGYAHDCQVCVNFKDRAIQFYVGADFEKLRDAADTLFNTLPPPMCVPPRYPGAAASTRQPASMQMFNDKHGGCFGEGAQILVLQGGRQERKDVADLVKGDRVIAKEANGRQLAATVLCVVKMLTNGSRVLAGLQGGLKITPWHPVRDKSSGKWTHPCRLPGARMMTTSAAVFNVVLDGGHAVEVSGWWAATLGRGFSGDVVHHRFWGTTAVLRSLEKLPGYVAGYVEIAPHQVRRDRCGEVCDFTPL